MGLFSFVGDALDDVGSFLEKPFRTGATAAARDAKVAGNVQMEKETALMNELGGIYQPQMDAGNQASQSLADYYSGNQQPIIDMATSSPMYSSLLNQREKAIARNSQATGGFRSGTTQENLASSSDDVLMEIINQILQGKQYVANTGANATNAYAQSKGSMLGAIGNTSGQIANVDINKAAQRGNILSGLLSAGSQIGTAAINSAGKATTADTGATD